MMRSNVKMLCYYIYLTIHNLFKSNDCQMSKYIFIFEPDEESAD